MTTTEPRWRRRPESRRDELLDAARELFVSKGLESTTVADIVGAAGLAKGSFYRYFESKEELFNALKRGLFERMIEQMLEAVTATVADQGVPEDADPLTIAAMSTDRHQAGVMSDAVIDSTVRFLFAERDLIALWWSQAQPRSGREKAWAQGIDGVIGLLTASIADGVQRGVMDCADPQRTARMLVYAVHMTTTHAVFFEREEKPDAVIDAAQRLARRSLGLPDPD